MRSGSPLRSGSWRKGLWCARRTARSNDDGQPSTGRPTMARSMKPGTSLYLDLVRFAAALTVFIEHLREHTRIGFAAFWKSYRGNLVTGGVRRLAAGG